MNDMTNMLDRLAEPFEPREIAWKPQAVSKDGTKCLAIAYIDARNVMDRLDAVLPFGHWKDSYAPQEHTVVCELSIKVNGEWVSRTDVGGDSSQPDIGDKRKAGFSDAFKRAAVKWGIGRYLYSLDGVWVSYDSQKKRITEEPKLPAWAMPRSNLTPVECDNLARLIADTKSDMPKILDYYNIKNIKEITRSAYQRLVVQLLAKQIGKMDANAKKAANA